MCSCSTLTFATMSIRSYFRPSNGLSEPTGSISIALKSGEQRTSSPPCAGSAEYFVTVHSIVPPRRKNSEHTRNTFRGKCHMIVPFSQPQRIDRKCFRAPFHTPTTLQPPLAIFFYMRGSLKYNHFFRKLFHGSFSLACLSLRARATRKLITLFRVQTLRCKIFVLS